MATFTRKAIMQTFLHILKNKPLDRITVKDICEQCEINRNTFYYYFKDIYDVLETIFEDEVRLVMDEAKEGMTFHDAYARAAALILNNGFSFFRSLHDCGKRQGIKDISGCRGHTGGAPLCAGKGRGLQPG